MKTILTAAAFGLLAGLALAEPAAAGGCRGSIDSDLHGRDNRHDLALRGCNTLEAATWGHGSSTTLGLGGHGNTLRSSQFGSGSALSGEFGGIHTDFHLFQGPNCRARPVEAVGQGGVVVIVPRCE